MKKTDIFEILRELGIVEVTRPANLQGSKASKVLKKPFSEQRMQKVNITGVFHCPFLDRNL
jgi:hypothetical protein